VLANPGHSSRKVVRALQTLRKINAGVSRSVGRGRFESAYVVTKSHEDHALPNCATSRYKKPDAELILQCVVAQRREIQRACVADGMPVAVDILTFPRGSYLGGSSRSPVGCTVGLRKLRREMSSFGDCSYINSAPICEPRRHLTRTRRPMLASRDIKRVKTPGIVSAARTVILTSVSERSTMLHGRIANPPSRRIHAFASLLVREALRL
jgi:hypothetical protein